MGTPPIELTICWKPAKSTTTKWSMVTPVFCWTVLIVHAAADVMSPAVVPAGRERAS